ncbi:hypothetical protein GCM10027299_36220 [Larkinella ripae]
MATAVLMGLSSCETTELARPAANFDGIYTVREAQDSEDYLLTLHNKADKANAVTIENLANLIKTPLEGEVQGVHLVIKEQPFVNYLGDQYTITGDGKMVNDVLVLHYTIKGFNGYAGAVFAKKQGGGGK